MFCRACWREIPYGLRVELVSAFEPGEQSDESSPFVRCGVRCRVELGVRRGDLTRDDADRFYRQVGIPA